MKRNRLLLLLVCFIVFLTSCASSQKYPNRPVELVIPFSAGNDSDIFARQFASIASEYLGQSITCINISGDQTNEAIKYVYEKPADGYTIMEITPSVLLSDMQSIKRVEDKKASSSNPVLSTEIIFRDEFEPLLKVQSDIQIFGVSMESQFKSIEELLDYAKAHPGELTIGGVSPKGLDEYIARGFAKEAGIEWKYVSYSSSDKALEALANGELDVYQDKMIRFLSLAQSDEIKPLVVLHDEQIDVLGLSECPASAEIGIPFTQGSWRGFVIKKGTPQDIKDKLIQSLKESYESTKYTGISEKNLTNIRDGYLEADEWRIEWDKEYEMLAEVFK